MQVCSYRLQEESLLGWFFVGILCCLAVDVNRNWGASFLVGLQAV